MQSDHYFKDLTKDPAEARSGRESPVFKADDTAYEFMGQSWGHIHHAVEIKNVT
jgi:hypothetical protein